MLVEERREDEGTKIDWEYRSELHKVPVVSSDRGS